MRKLIAVGAVVTAALSIAACGGSGHQYPANVQTNFLNACEAHGTTQRCGCALHYVENHISLDKFQVAEQGIAAGGDTPRPHLAPTQPVRWVCPLQVVDTSPPEAGRGDRDRRTGAWDHPNRDFARLLVP